MSVGPAPYVARLLTPRGRGAVATIEVRGSTDTADHPVDRWFLPAGRTAAARLPINRIAFGQWNQEDVVVCRCAEDVVEVHCHGGRVAVARILDDLCRTGCRTPEQTAPLQNDVHGFEAFAKTVVREMTDRFHGAKTLKAANLLLSQLSGGLAASLESLLHADSQEAGHQMIAGLLGDLTDESSDRIVTGRNVALFGQPNAGKSSLMNSLLGYERAIVFDQPGTTRDALMAETAFAGWPVRLIDTAGVRHNVQSDLEASGIARAELAIDSADVILLLFDVNCGWAAADEALLARVPDGVPVIVVANKIDLQGGVRIPGAGRFDRPVADVIPVSATLGTGIDLLVESLGRQLQPADADTAVIGSPALRACLRSMLRGGIAADFGLQAVIDRLRRNVEFLPRQAD